MAQSPRLTLRDGHSMPQLGFGIWTVPAETTVEAVQSALEVGYRLVDGAYIYGNEAGLGEGLRRAGLPREEIFVTTKVWNSDHGRARTRASVERSLETIGIEELDLVLVHWPVPMQNLYVETWTTLIELQQEGLVRSIGVSNFNAEHLERIVSETGVTPVLNQIELNPKLQQPELRATHAGLGILSQAWTPLGAGRSFDEKVIADAAARSGKSPAQIILRWHLQLGHALITRSVNPARQAENLEVFDFELTAEELAAIEALDVGLRTGPDPSVFKLM